MVFFQTSEIILRGFELFYALFLVMMNSAYSVLGSRLYSCFHCAMKNFHSVTSLIFIKTPDHPLPLPLQNAMKEPRSYYNSRTSSLS